jgi:hypothetical protein
MMEASLTIIVLRDRGAEDGHVVHLLCRPSRLEIWPRALCMPIRAGHMMRKPD